MAGIVVIEQDKHMRGLLVEWLSAAGHSVRAPASGEMEAPESPPDLVIVDVYMPRREGAQRLRAIRTAHPTTPVIAISGQFRPGIAGSCTAADALGVQHVIAKPFSQGDLLAAVDRVTGPAG